MDSFSCCEKCDDQAKATWLYGVPWILGVAGEGFSLGAMNWVATPLLSLSCISFLVQCQVRGTIREALKLDEDCCEDCCVSYFCYACALVQERKELKEQQQQPTYTKLMFPPSSMVD